MEYSAESLHFLHIAYVLMFLGQVAYVTFLLYRWLRLKTGVAGPKSHDA